MKRWNIEPLAAVDLPPIWMRVNYHTHDEAVYGVALLLKGLEGDRREVARALRNLRCQCAMYRVRKEAAA